MLRNKQAQSTLEYVIILTAIVGAILAIVLTTIGKKNANSGLGKTMNQSAEKIKAASGKIANLTE